MTALIIANTQIRQDASGRFCLNDLHQASGGANRHRPSLWLENRQTQDLVAEIVASPASQAGIPASDAAHAAGPSACTPVDVVNEGFARGTYAVKELVYAYAMWISAAFHLHVIRAYDAMVTQARAEPAPALLPQPQHRADQLVSAGRIFSAALRTARGMRLPHRDALSAAYRCALRHTGIDWPDELGVSHNALPEPDAAPSSVSRWGMALAEGLLRYQPGIGLTRDWYAVYCDWCCESGERPASLKEFVHGMSALPMVSTTRQRYIANGEVVGPHACMDIGQQEAPPGMEHKEFVGRCIQRVRNARMQTA